MPRKRTTREHLRIRPMAVQSGEKTEIRISAKSDHARFIPGESVMIRMQPMSCRPFPRSPEAAEENILFVDAGEDGALVFEAEFSGEQEHALQLFVREEEQYQKLCTLSVYSLRPDLYALRPFRGDTHVHSTGSDGREAPAMVAAAYRRAGFDFMALTDHRNYESSLEAIGRLSGLETDLSLFPGEEVHVPEGMIHAVNFGGSFGVNRYYAENKEKAEEEIAQIIPEITDPACPDPVEYACRLWVARKIRSGGGLAIFVHPHWITSDYYCTSDAMTEYVLKKKEYDAFELLNGQTAFENNLQTALYANLREEGLQIPIVGASDSHSSWEPGHFEEQYTVIFAAGRSFDGVKEAILSRKSVAVESMRGETPRVYGDYRLVKYAIFLNREYFPEYKSLCFEQGQALLRHLSGERDETELLSVLSGRTDRYADAFFGR